MAAQYQSSPAPHAVVQDGQPAASAIQAPAQYPGTAVAQNSYSSERYNAKSARVTGLMQLACAIACTFLGISQLLIRSTFGDVGAGIWGGMLVMFPTGILGLVSRKGNTSVIVAYMVMSIISAIAGFVLIDLGCTAAINSGETNNMIAFDSLLGVTGLVELVVAIVAAGYCCAAVCRGRNPSTSTTVVYTYQNPATPMVMMVPNYGQPDAGQPMPMGLVSQQPLPTDQPQGTYPAPVANPQANDVPGPQPNMAAQAPPAYFEMAPAPSNDLTLPEKMEIQ